MAHEQAAHQHTPAGQQLLAAEPAADVARPVPIASWSETMRTAPRDPAPFDRPRPARLRPLVPIPVYRSPESAPIALLPVESHPGFPTWLPVIDERPGWALVLLPVRPDGRVGWVRLDDQMDVAEHDVHIEVDTRTRVLTLHHGRNFVSWSAGVGRATRPTPRGRTVILGEIRPGRGLVHHALVLSSHMKTHLAHGADMAAVGLHSWSETQRGVPTTDGSVVVSPEAFQVLVACAPAGTTVRIR